MSRKHIVSLILIILIVVMIADFNVNGVSVFEDYFRQLETESLKDLQNGSGYGNYKEDYQAKKDDSLLIAAGDIDQLKINNNLGSVEITGENRTDISVNYEITVYAEAVAEAREFIKKLEIKKAMTQQKLEIYLQRVSIPQAINGIRIDYDIKAPVELALLLRNRHGRLHVTNFNNDVILSNYYDELVVSNIEGKVDLLCRYGNLDVNNIKGSAQIKTAYNKAQIKNLQQGLTLNARYCQAEVTDVAQGVNIDSRYGALIVNKIEGSLELDSEYTQITGSDINGKLEADSRYGGIDLNNVNNNIEINAEYLGVRLNLSSQLTDYTVNCRTEYGDIRTNLTLDLSSYKNTEELIGKIGDGTKNITVATRHGDIFINQ